MNGFYNGVLYRIEYSRALSYSISYNRIQTYKVYTDEENFHTCKKAIIAILKDEYNEDCGISAGEHALAKNMATALKRYHKMEWSDKLDCLLFTIVDPYND